MDQDNGRAHEQDRVAPVSSPSLLPLMQSLLATLANLDAEHEHEIGRITRSSTPASLKPHLLAKLNERHRERREPYVQQLAILNTSAGDQADKNSPLRVNQLMLNCSL